MKTKLLGVAAACVLALTFGTAKADTYDYQLSLVGMSQYGQGSVSGTFSGPVFDNLSGQWQWRFFTPPSLSAYIYFNLPGLPQTPTVVMGWESGPLQLILVTSTGTLGPNGWDLTSNNIYGGFSLHIAGDLFTGGAVTGTFYALAEQCSFGGNCLSPRVNFTVTSGTLTATPLPDVPLPAALPLFATGLGVLGLLGWRRKRKAAI